MGDRGARKAQDGGGKGDPALKALARRGFRFKKDLGQHFLFNNFVLEQIVEAAAVRAGDLVVEAGAGAGSLTAALAEKGAKVIAVELDRALIPFLSERFKNEPDVEILQGDVMKLDPDALAPAYKICANLPYNISTPFISKAFLHMQGLEAGAVLLQKEVADKVTALPGQENYGLLALAAARYGETRQVLTLEPGYFTPRPPVDSALVGFRRDPPALGADERALWTVIRGLFNQRRKNLSNGLKSLGTFVPANGISWAEALESAGLDRNRRPETLSLAEFATLVKAAGY